MGFDDLARHMASRDGKKPAEAGSAEQFIAEAAEADRRLDRKRDLILGPVLLIGGLIILALIVLYLVDAFSTTPDPRRPPDNTGSILVPTGGVVFSLGMVIRGLFQTVRGLRGRSG